MSSFKSLDSYDLDEIAREVQRLTENRSVPEILHLAMVMAEMSRRLQESAGVMPGQLNEQTRQQPPWQGTDSGS